MLVEYAAAFFLLGGSLKDAVNVCIKYLNDFQLAIALARIVEQSNEGSILIDILTNSVLPTAFALGNRWLGSWAFWMLHRRDLAVRILLVSGSNIKYALQKSYILPDSITRHRYCVWHPSHGYRRTPL